MPAGTARATPGRPGVPRATPGPLGGPGRAPRQLRFNPTSVQSFSRTPTDSGDLFLASGVTDRAARTQSKNRFQGTARFGGTFLTATHAHENFVAKLDPQGGFLWAVPAGTSAQTYQAVAVDGAGNAYLAASFADTATLGSITLQAKGPADVLVARLEPGGKVLWAIPGSRGTRTRSSVLPHAGYPVFAPKQQPLAV